MSKIAPPPAPYPLDAKQAARKDAKRFLRTPAAPSAFAPLAEASLADEQRAEREARDDEGREQYEDELRRRSGNYWMCGS